MSLPVNASQPSEQVQKLLGDLGYTYVKTLAKGHGFCDVLQIQDKSLKMLVIKYGSGDSAASEIKDNASGFDSIAKSGAGQLLPKPFYSGQTNGYSFIVLPYLGESITQTAKNGNEINWASFWDNLSLSTDQTIKPAVSPEQGLAYYLEGLKVWLEIIAARLPNETVEALVVLKKINAKQLYTQPISSLMLCDFTPDNLFIDGTKISFIDPWSQKTFLGSFIPSIGQFLTLYQQIYRLSSPLIFTKNAKDYIYKLSKQLGLSPGQAKAQLELGASFQYALSSFVRIDSDPQAASTFMKRSLVSLKQVAQENL